MSDRFAMGAVFIPLKEDEIAPAMHLIARVAGYMNEMCQNLDDDHTAIIDESDLAEKLVSDLKFDFDQQGWSIRTATIEKVQGYIKHWAGFVPDFPHYFSDNDGIQIVDAKNFDIEFVSNVIQMLQINYELPPIEFQAIIKYEQLKPDVCVGFAAHVEADHVVCMSTDEFLDELNKKATRLVDYIAQNETEKALEHIHSGKEDLDAFEGRAIKWAFRRGNVDVFKALVEHGARIDWPELNTLLGHHPEMKAIVQARIMKTTVEIENEERGATVASPALRRPSL